jgi:hypothetical protein
MLIPETTDEMLIKRVLLWLNTCDQCGEVTSDGTDQCDGCDPIFGAIEWLLPGDGLLCKSCGYRRSMQIGFESNKVWCNKVRNSERGHPELVRYAAGNETCRHYLSEADKGVVYIDAGAVELELLEQLVRRDAFNVHRHFVVYGND